MQPQATTRMYLKSVIIDGFKSYGRRTEIHGFDPEFSAITGLNGTGKSNILDAICFVLGITNLGQVRATSLQDLVFKSGQSGVTKATVTLVFQNSSDCQQISGYDKCSEVSVTRQVVIGGKTKYLINGKNVLNKKVMDFFCSLQLNVNNPSFLIMQGRITKVLNMKPQEILSMIEEAAGTSVYESKREISKKLIEKKDAKIRETNTLLKEDVEPRLEKLKQDRADYNEFQKLCREIEYLTRIHISYKYLKKKESLTNSEKTITKLNEHIENNKQTIISNDAEVKTLENHEKKLLEKIDSSTGGHLVELETELSKKTSFEAKTSGEIKGIQGTIEQEKKKLSSIEKSVKDDVNVLRNKENQMEKVQGLFQKLKDLDKADAEAYAEAQKRFEDVTQGLSTNDDGEAASLQDQLMTAKQHIIESDTVIKKSDMELRHNNQLLKKKQRESQTNDSAYLKDKQMYERVEAEIIKLTEEISKIKYKEGYLESLQQKQSELTNDIRRLKSQLDRKNAFQYELQYTDPEPNFDRSKVYGMVGKLFSVKDERNSLALTMCGGGSLYSYVTEDDVTSKKILQKGQLQRRITIIPINKITSSSVQSSAVKLAQNLVGKENVSHALSLVKYHEHFDPVMKYVFGRTLICKDMNIAKQVTFHKNINCRSVTLDGDIVDPEGTLSGGSKPKGGNILQDLSEIQNLETELKEKEDELRKIMHEITSVEKVAKLLESHKQKLDLRNHELKACSDRLAQTTFQQNQNDIEALKTKIQSLGSDLEAAREKKMISTNKVKDLESKLTDAKGYRERELKKATDAMKQAKEKSEASKGNWKKREQEYETLRLEIEEIKKIIQNSENKVQQFKENIHKLEEEFVELKNISKAVSEEIAILKGKIKQLKDTINSQNKELKATLVRKDKLTKQNQELQLDIKKKENEVIKVKNDNKDGFSEIDSYERKYTWIKDDFSFFGIKNTRYDYSKEDPIEAGRKLVKIREKKEQMERNINTKAMILLEREEEQYNETIRRKEIVEMDKKKIQQIICTMDEKKREKLDKSWKDVNKHFSSIFSTLLPGADAKLNPVIKNNDLFGLEIKVGFNGVWKESLGELSGGQRSLVALSLILSMLKYSPAPLYILDEVDAALDMSHTQNIGSMLKKHFNSSQFIIVSLKDGMFNNANVLFRTKFEEGVSVVTRAANRSK